MRRDLFGLVGRKGAREVGPGPRISLYESEAVRISQYAQSSPQIEIGGDLFGFYAPGGSPLVFVASGPGPAARRDVTHFQQDPKFQADVFNQLALNFRMFYVGDWHSHHSLGLSRPSGPDDAKLQDLANKNGWPQLFSLIVETAHHRDDISSTGPRGEPDGPIEGFGIWWNAFHYVFREHEHVRQRVDIEFQTGANPYETTSENIDETLRRELHQAGHGARGLTSSVLPPLETLGRSEITIGGNEFLINIYQNICRILSRELVKAEMEVELESPGGPRLVVFDGGEKVICSILGRSDLTLGVVVEPIGGKEIAFEVPCDHGQIEQVDVRRIVACVVSQFKPTRDRNNKRSKRA